MANIYTVDVRLYATAYIRASSAKEALEIAKRELSGEFIEVAEQRESDIPITGERFSPEMPDVSLSPAMTIKGPDRGERAYFSCFIGADDEKEGDTK